ncbi:REP-associated tyrosine transposase [Frateuria defendens]|uniref:REP-associated tyrosine transposase n=1 Tax=Frateuria defendens TaxID=2219559 RepID=UPI003018AF18
MLGDARLLCWVLMPDHWHGLVELGEHDGLTLAMARFKSLVSRNVHAAIGMRHVWARGFHDRALRHDESVLTAARYIVTNPVRAGLVSRVGDYPYWNCAWL